jgi:hypothetical protein
MYRGNSSSRVLPVILVLIVVAIAIAALVSLGRVVFGGGDETTQTQTDTSRDALLSIAADRAVRMTVRGPLVADENFRSYQVTIDPASRSIVTYAGYGDHVLDSRSYGNTIKAYEEFVYALDKANFTKGEAFKEAQDDTRGICATGNVYVFEVLRSGSTVKRLWTSTCKGSLGSLKASVSQVKSLIVGQIPDSAALLRTINQ